MTQDTISLDLQKRDVTGKSVKHLRKEGTVPAVIHDHGKPSLVVQGNGVQMLKVWRAAGKHHPVQIASEGKKYTAIIKTADFDPKKHLLTHIVFNAVSATEKVATEIPVHAKYDEGNESSPAERAGFIVLAQLETVAVEAIASKLPDAIYYNAEKLVEVGDSVTVADLIPIDGVTITIEDTHAVATVFEPSALAAANDAAGGDAEEDDAANVESETESNVVEGDQAAESKPGGKGQDEPKQSAVDAAKADA